MKKYEIILFILLMISVLAAIYIDKLSNCCLVTASSVVFIYCLYKLKWIISAIKKLNLELTSYSRKLIAKSKVSLIIFIPIWIVNILVILKCDKLPIYIWYLPLMIMMYNDSVYLSGIIALGEQQYVSGKYIIDYKDITRIDVVKEFVTYKGIIYLVELYNDEKIIGFDKLFDDEYQKIRLMTH